MIGSQWLGEIGFCDVMFTFQITGMIDIAQDYNHRRPLQLLQTIRGSRVKLDPCEQGFRVFKYSA